LSSAVRMTDHFGKRLRRLRGERSQKEVAAGIGIPTTTYASLEQQETVPRGPVLQRVCDYFGASPDYFFPPVKKEASPAREWLRAQRSRSFDVAPTIATYSLSQASSEEKEKLDNLIGERVGKS
jgi:transcriptional regulator with XRE-family HTH domain